jgi:hypothetical protein
MLKTSGGARGATTGTVSQGGRIGHQTRIRFGVERLLNESARPWQ